VGNNEGNALGKEWKQTDALKGRDNFPERPPRSMRSIAILRPHLVNDLPGMRGFVAPFQGLVVNSRGIPRALPWADLLQPVPGEESVLGLPPRQNAQRPLIESFEAGARKNRMNHKYLSRVRLKPNVTKLLKQLTCWATSFVHSRGP
jgi:hypothetical protein